MVNRLPFLIALLTLVVASGPGRPAAAPILSDLRGVEELKTLFNSDAGKVRLVLLVSPT